MKTQYRIIGRFIKDKDPHVVDWSAKWTKQDAEARLQQLIIEQERTKKRGYSQGTAGLIGIRVDYHSDYELVDLKIQSRQVTEWS